MDGCRSILAKSLSASAIFCSNLQPISRAVIKLLDEGNKVRVTVLFRGREITLTQKGRELLAKIAEDTKEYAVVEQSSRMEGRIMHMILAPK